MVSSTFWRNKHTISKSKANYLHSSTILQSPLSQLNSDPISQLPTSPAKIHSNPDPASRHFSIPNPHNLGFNPEPKTQKSSASPGVSAMSEPSLKAVTLTHVRYQRGDPLGYFLAWISLIPVFISLGGFVCHFFFRRELQGMFFAVGLLISQVINELIKDFFQQARPETCALLEMCDSHGWPSSHSQYMFFFATYFTLLTYKGIGLSDTTNKWAVIFPPWVLALLTMYSRVYLGYHTVAQVFAGSALGVFLGAVWFWVVNSVLYPSFPMMEESWFGRYFYIKDTSHIPNVLKFEYDNARDARTKLAAKSN